MKISITELRRQVVATLQPPFGDEHANAIADCLLWADMSGFHTQGVLKMTGIDALHKIAPKHDITIERETQLSQLVNAGAHPAMVVSKQATDAVIAKAQQHGFGLVGVHNTFSSNGALSYYADLIAKQDMIGIVMARSPGSIAPFDSLDPLFGTNPIAFAFPTNEEPLVFDMATSAMTWYGLVLAHAKGEQIPSDMAVKRDGTPTTDPQEAMNGALLPFDRGHKGAGLAMIVEIMAGPLAASAYCDCDTFKEEWGSTFIALDPNLLVDRERFKADCSALVATVRNSRPKPEVSEIRVPGDRMRRAYREAVTTGFVDIDEATLRELNYL